MAEDKENSEDGRVDRYFGKLCDWASERISRFVSFLFLLFGIGVLFGAMVVPSLSHYRVYFLGAPFALALIAYYNRGVASVLFMGLILIFAL